MAFSVMVRKWPSSTFLLFLFAYIQFVACQCANETTINGQSFPSLIDVTLEDLVGGLEQGLFSSVDLVNVRIGPSFPSIYGWTNTSFKAYVARIQEVNDTLHMVTELNPDAVSIAAELDAERASGQNRGSG